MIYKKTNLNDKQIEKNENMLTCLEILRYENCKPENFKNNHIFNPNLLKKWYQKNIKKNKYSYCGIIIKINDTDENNIIYFDKIVDFNSNNELIYLLKNKEYKVKYYNIFKILYKFNFNTEQEKKYWKILFNF